MTLLLLCCYFVFVVHCSLAHFPGRPAKILMLILLLHCWRWTNVASSQHKTAQTCPRFRKFYFKTPNRKFASCLHVAPASGHATKWQTNEIESLAKLRSPEKLANAVTTGWRRAPKGVGNELHPSRPEPVLSNAPAVVCSCYAQSVAKADSTLPPQGSKKAHEQHKNNYKPAAPK